MNYRNNGKESHKDETSRFGWCVRVVKDLPILKLNEAHLAVGFQ